MASSSSSQPLPQNRHFPLSEIIKATNNFDESCVIAKGGYGTVYKGQVSDEAGNSIVAAIKRWDPNSNQGPSEFYRELNALLSVAHHNIVPVIGYCDTETEVEMDTSLTSRRPNPKPTYTHEMLILYEYMPNGSLSDLLFNSGAPISWSQRLSICIGSAHGLHYLHRQTSHGLIHRDIKTTNILLDKSGVTKISDFGLAILGTSAGTSPVIEDKVAVGTFGYMDPHYLHTKLPTRKLDIFSFGVVLLEVLFRKRALDDSLDDEVNKSLIQWFMGNVTERNLMNMIDSEITEEICPDCLMDFYNIAKRCVSYTPQVRPDIEEVVSTLELAAFKQHGFNNSHVPAIPHLEIEEALPNSHLKIYTSNDLEKVTRGFLPDLLIAESSDVQVYLGWVDKITSAPSNHVFGLAVAVKRVHLEHPLADNEWPEEVNFIGQVNHPNVIKLIGCGRINEGDYLYVYEHMKKSLSHYIHGDDSLAPLSWNARLSILIGVAQGLSYLYSTKNAICHFRCEDILLGDDLNPKLGGFGWVTNDPENQERHDTIMLNGTFGYRMANECITGQSLNRDDIYSFGVVLFEAITGRPLTDKTLKDVSKQFRRANENKSKGKNLLKRLKQAVKKKSKGSEIEKVTDPRLVGRYPLEGVIGCVDLALRCLSKQPEVTPSREEILETLGNLAVCQE